MHMEDLEMGTFFGSTERRGGHLPSFKWYISLCFVEVAGLGLWEPICNPYFFPLRPVDFQQGTTVVPEQSVEKLHRVTVMKRNICTPDRDQ